MNEKGEIWAFVDGTSILVSYRRLGRAIVPVMYPAF